MLKITNPETGAELEVANQDFPNELSWADAKKACDELGNGWRLPTKNELKAMYEQLQDLIPIEEEGLELEKEQGSFELAYYWSSTVDDDLEELDFELDELDSSEIMVYAWIFGFHNGHDTTDDKEYAYYVRAVRDL
jgi:hypothetical protein